ncbi:ABC transporter ATP-binding protein [Patulibacter minatonensis]|uniref:ABC transporter ATP-binding protein n=1 Tax=Patulibacter minatonensis TaxID=298163 RepID=UPI0004B19C9F|nr:ABC transporter ATP-binding protein [Patulibacter minatonensis]
MSGRLLLPTASPRETRRAIGRLVRPRRGLAVAALGLLVAAAAAGLLVPPLLGRLVDVTIDRGTVSELTAPAVLLGAAAVTQGLLTAVGGLLLARLGEALLAELRERVVARSLELPLEELDGAGAGDVLSRVSGDVAVVSQAIRTVLPAVATAGFTVALTVGGLVLLDWRLAVAALAAVPIQVVGLRWYLRTVVPIYRRERVVQGERTQQLVDSVSGARTVRALGLHEDREARVRASSERGRDVALEGVLRLRGFLHAVNGAELVGLASVLVVGFLLVRADALTVGAATAGALYFHRAFDPVGELLMVFDDLQEAMTALARMVGVASLPETARDGAETEDAHRHHGPVDVDVLALRHDYGGSPVLHGVDVRIAAGEHVALIGTTGAGKTTFAKIVAGVLEPSAGDVRIGGTALGDLGPGELRRTVALVAQEPHVFAGTLADDLRLVAPGAPDDELWDALRHVGADGWVRELPDGLGTRVGEGGLRLSATRVQHLALARIVLRDVPVVLLDEATAEAGSAGARILEDAALRALRGRTSVVVAHRLTQAATADRVLVMDRGEIVEDGHHDELVAAGGRYADLWLAWTGAGRDAPAG